MRPQQAQRIQEKLGYGVEITPDGHYRHPQWKKNLPPETPIMDGDLQLHTSKGTPVTAGMCLPWRLDLATDDDGKLIHQETFEKRHLIYRQDECIDIRGFDVAVEPKADIREFVLSGYDPTSESNAMVEMDFRHGDSGPPPSPEQKATARQAAEARGPWQEGQQADDRATRAEQLYKLHQAGDLTDEALSRQLAEIFKADIPLVESEPASSSTALDAPVERAQPAPGTVVAPCGKQVKERGLGAHIAKCQDAFCLERKARKSEAAAAA